jgi:acetyl esterase/lipase
VAHWDNSRNNPFNPDPDKTVRWGLQTWDEMMVGWVAYVWERPETADELAKNPPNPADVLFDKLDRNGDDVVTPDEIPDQMKPLMVADGGKLPEKITREQFAEIFKELSKRLPARKPRAQPAGGEKKPEARPEPVKPAAAPAPAAPAAKVGGNFPVEVVSDVAYYEGEGADANKHKLDLYLPKGHKDFPVLFFVHGGGWTSGDRKLYGGVGRVFAKNGVGTAVISYRLTPQVHHPGHIEDVARAFAWTHEHIGKYGGRPDQVFVTGHSAGGHLAALLATDESYLKARGLSLADIKGAMPMSGVYTIAPGRMERIFGKGEGAAAASPTRHVSAKSPPFLILYADGDFANCDRMSEELCEALRKNKVEASCVKVKDRNHIGIMFRLMTSEADPASQALLEFVANHSGMKLKPREG